MLLWSPTKQNTNDLKKNGKWRYYDSCVATLRTNLAAVRRECGILVPELLTDSTSRLTLASQRTQFGSRQLHSAVTNAVLPLVKNDFVSLVVFYSDCGVSIANFPGIPKLRCAWVRWSRNFLSCRFIVSHARHFWRSEVCKCFPRNTIVASSSFSTQNEWPSPQVLLTLVWISFLLYFGRPMKLPLSTL